MASVDWAAPSARPLSPEDIAKSAAPGGHPLEVLFEVAGLAHFPVPAPLAEAHTATDLLASRRCRPSLSTTGAAGHPRQLVDP